MDNLCTPKMQTLSTFEVLRKNLLKFNNISLVKVLTTKKNPSFLN